MTDTNEKAATKPPVAEHPEREPENTEGQVASAPGGGEAGGQADGDPLAEVTAERDKLREQLLRTAADFDNFRKRSKRDLDDARARARDDLVRELLPVFDNLERAVQTSDTASDLRSVVDGVRMVLKLFEDTTERMGLTRVPALGERFDPAVHEAIQHQESAEHPPGTIIAEVVAGYRFGERLVRPSMVVVARKPSEAKPADGQQSGEAAAQSTAPASTTRPPSGASKRPPQSGSNGAGEAGHGSAAPADPKDSE